MINYASVVIEMKIGRKSKPALALVAFSLMATLLASCSGANVKVSNVSADKFQAKIKDSGVIVLDVRTPDEFAAGHIANSINIDVEGKTFDQQIGQLDKSAEYAVYCRSGRRSAIAVEKMGQAGFTKLTNLESGINEWVAAGYPLVTS